MVAGDETAQLKFSKVSSPPPPQHFTKLQKYYWRRYYNEGMKTAAVPAPQARKKKAMKATKK